MAPRRVKVPKPVPDARIDRFLASQGVSIERARALLAEGRVRVNGKLCKPARKLWGGEELEVDFPEPTALPPVNGPAIPVLFESASVIVVNKPAGVVVEREPRQVSLVELLASQRNGFDVNGVAAPGVVHRLDKETSGCLALAKNDAAMQALEAAFQGKQVEKIYLAIVQGAPPEHGRLERPYARDPENPRKYTTRVESPRRAALAFRRVEQLRDSALVEISLETGRTHQIRVQFSEAGFPVIGDAVYGVASSEISRVALHAWKLRIPALGVDVEAEWPEDLRAAVEKLRAS